jgi:hypothetical protein
MTTPPLNYDQNLDGAAKEPGGQLCKSDPGSCMILKTYCQNDLHKSSHKVWMAIPIHPTWRPDSSRKGISYLPLQFACNRNTAR